MSHRFTYRPGPATAVCVADTAVLIGLSVTHPLVARLYELLLRGPAIDEVTDLLAGSYGEFTNVILLRGGDPVEVFLWGSCGAESTGGVSVAGGPIGTEHRLSGLVGAWLGTAVVPSASMLPAGLGVFPAERIETTPVPVLPASPMVAGQVPILPVAGPAASSPLVPAVPVMPAGSAVPSAPPVTSPAPAAFMADHTRFSPAGAPLPGIGAPRSPAVAAGVPFLSATPVPPSPQPRPPADEPYVPVAPPPMGPGEQPIQFDFDDTIRPLVALARRCPEGHVSPAYLDACEVCGAALGGDPFEMPPVSLGRLVMSTGGEITLDHDAIVGRNPRLPADLTGPTPELVKVMGSSKDVSNRHVQVRVSAGQVLVSDLGSTNGTEIVRPGWPPVPLPAGQEVAIEPGTHVVLASAVTLTYER